MSRRLMQMRIVSVSDLKARLSHYLLIVRRGGEIEVVKRGVPVARIVGIVGAAVGQNQRIDRLVRAGAVRRGTGDMSWILNRPPVRMTRGSLSEALERDRGDRG